MESREVWRTGRAEVPRSFKQALRSIQDNPKRPGSKERPELAKGARTYHLWFSRDRAQSSLGMVRSPRHFPIYRRGVTDVIEVSRVLHDSCDLERHLPENYRRR